MMCYHNKVRVFAQIERLVDSTKDEDIDSVIDRLTQTYVDIAAEEIQGKVHRGDVTSGATKQTQDRWRAAGMGSTSFSGW